MHPTEGGTHWALSLDDNSTTQMGPLLLFLPKKKYSIIALKGNAEVFLT